MKKLISIIIISIMLIQPAMAAADIPDLSAEKQMEFMNNSLSIQTEQNTYSYGSTIGNVWGNGVVTGTAFGNATTTTDWRPYLGPMEIDKGTFYEITEQTELKAIYDKGVAEEKKKHDIGWGRVGAGAGLFVLCTIFGPLGTAEGWWDGTVGMIGILLGAGLLGGTTIAALSIPFLTWEFNDNVSVSFAVGVADMYNQRLAESLR